MNVLLSPSYFGNIAYWLGIIQSIKFGLRFGKIIKNKHTETDV